MKKLFMITCLAVCLSGCGKEVVEYSGDVHYLNVPVDTNMCCSVPVPVGCDVSSSDGLSRWDLSNGVTVSVYNSGYTQLPQVGGDVYAKEGQVELVKDNYSVVVSGESSYTERIKNMWLEEDPIVKLRPMWNMQHMLDEFPPFASAEGVISDKGVLMPGVSTSVKDNLYKAEVYKDDSDYFIVYVRSDFYEDIRGWLYTVLNTYGDAVKYWYEDEIRFYGYTDNICVGAKKVTENKYIVYTSSPNMRNYILLNMSGELKPINK